MNPLSTAYIASIETITPPPGYKIFYCAKMSRFLEAVGDSGLPQHTQFPYALASFSRFGKHFCSVAFRKIHRLPSLLPVQNVAFDLRSGRSSLCVRAFASIPMLSVPIGAGSGGCAHRGTPATGLVNPAMLRR